jgi:hypothetical protein
MTTDTTEAPQYASKRGSVEDSDNLNAAGMKEGGDSQDQIEEGILSSDEEEREADDKKTNKSFKVVGDKPLASASDSHDIRNFAGDSGAATSKLYESDKAREEIENKFNFGEQDVEYFGAKIQSRSDRDLGVAA